MPPNKLKGCITKPPRPNVVRKETYRVFEEEYKRSTKVIRLHLKKKGIVLNSIENVMKAVRVLDAIRITQS